MKKNKPAKLINTRKHVDTAIEISQINARISTLNAELKQLKERRETLIKRIIRMGQFTFRDSMARLFRIELHTVEREVLDQELAKQIIDEAGYEIPTITQHWNEARVYHLEEF